MYNAEITFHQGSKREYTLEDSFDTLEECVIFLERKAMGKMLCRAWINAKELPIRNGCVLGNDGEPLCTNEAWHEIFAPQSLRIPTNPQTYADRKEPL